MSTGETWTLGRRPALDGVRGVAILLVLAGHGWVPWDYGSAGKIGVAVFFALSGFLITSLLLEERSRTGSVDYRAFYIRRARRLLPASLAAVAVLVTFAQIAAPELLPLRSALAAVFYLGNVEPFGLVAHFWSLAVEEQFYLVWPFVLALLLRRRTPHLSVVLLVAGAASALVRSFTGGTLLFEQADALLAGCALAVVMHRRSEGAVHGAVPVVALVVLIGLSLLPFAVAERVGMTAAGVVAAAMIWASAQGPGPVWLRARWLVWVGRRSYGLYLWHYPIGFVVAEGLNITAWLPFLAIVAPLSLAVTVLSWRYVEQPPQAKRALREPVEQRLGARLEVRAVRQFQTGDRRGVRPVHDRLLEDRVCDAS